MIEYIIIIVAVISAIIALLQEDLLKAAILVGISGLLSNSSVRYP